MNADSFISNILRTILKEMKRVEKSHRQGYEIKTLGNLIHRRTVLKACKIEGLDDITVMHGWILGYLNNNSSKEIYQKDIEESFDITRSTVTNILKLMEKKGYIKRSSVEHDARLKKIELTPLGKEMNEKTVKAMDKLDLELEQIFTEEELDSFLKSLSKLKKKVKEDLNEACR